MRLYAIIPDKLLPHHHIRVPKDIILDLQMWKQFLHEPQAYCRPFEDFDNLTANEIFMYSDASKAEDLGFGALCQDDWMKAMWRESIVQGEGNFINEYNPSIAFLELYALTAGVIEWIHRFANKRITLFCDNESVVNMVNKGVSLCDRCMVLLRH